MNEPITYPRSPRRSFPIRMALLVLVLILVLILILVLRDTFDPAARAAREAAAYRQDMLNDRLSGLDTLIAAGWRILPLAMISGAAFVALSIAWRRWGTHDYIKAQHITEITRAQTQRLPASLHTLTLHAGRQPLPVPPAALAPGSTVISSIDQPLTAPLFSTLLDQGQIGPDSDGRRQPLILGYGLDGPITGDWRSLYSTGLGGLQGSGKTWAATFLLAQSALNEARLVIGDPHAGDSESLATRTTPLAPAFLCDIADDDRSILAALQLADDELQRRKHGHPERWPLIVAIDEWTSLRRGKLAEILPELIEDFTTEGRKLNCHLMLLAQRWDKESVGEFRNTLASAYVHRMRPAEARMMTGLPASVMPNDTLQLAPGECYLLDTRGQLVRVRIPLMTPDDIQQVARIIEERSSLKEITRPFGFQPGPRKKPDETLVKATNETHESSSGRNKNLSPEAARILTLFRQGMSIGEIVKAIYGELTGPKYNRARSEIEAAIRESLERIQ